MFKLCPILRVLTIVLSASWSVFGQSSVPAEYQDLYTQLKNQLTAFDGHITSAWDGSTFPTDVAAEVQTANGNRGVQLLQQNTRAGVSAELTRLRSLGARAVVVSIPYPLLNRAYFSSLGRDQDYQGFLSFYKFVAGEVRNRRMRLLIGNGPIFPGVFSAESGINAAQHYASLTTQQYVQARVDMLATIAGEIQPDYLNIGSEPDTEAEITGKAGLASVAGYAGLVSQAVAQIRAAAPRVEIGAGVGTWLATGRQYIESFAQAGVSYIDLHVYPVNRNFLDNLETYTDLGISLGKKVTIGEAWLLKERDSELGTTSPAADPTIFARDAFQFWAPLDQQFLQMLVRFSHWKQIALLSPFWTRYLFAYVDYTAERGKSPDVIMIDAAIAAANAIVQNQFSDTGIAYRTAVTTGTFALSNSSFRGDQLAPESIVSVFGAGLASGQTMASGMPLPPSLRGVTAAAIDSQGRQFPTSFYGVFPNQLTLVLPAGMAEGRALLRITAESGQTLRASMKIRKTAPGLSTASGDGYGPPAALVARYAMDGTVTYDLVFDCSASGCVPKPIDLSRNDQVYLALFGTGIRNRSSLSSVVVNIGGVNISPVYAGAQSEYPGLDQINLPLPKSLAGRGEVSVAVTADGQTSNAVLLNLR